jgi:hypothetical protein
MKVAENFVNFNLAIGKQCRKIKMSCWRHDIEHNDFEHNDPEHYDIEHNDTEHYDMQHNNKKK